jgi:hypothetical protein
LCGEKNAYLATDKKSATQTNCPSARYTKGQLRNSNPGAKQLVLSRTGLHSAQYVTASISQAVSNLSKEIASSLWLLAKTEIRQLPSAAKH